MRRAMMNAEVGDDCFGDDPTVKKLEAIAAEKIGKEAAIYVPSGTMGNSVAILTHANSGDNAIIEAESHIYFYESGAMASLGGIMPIILDDPSGCPRADQIKPFLNRDATRYPKTSLICLENTHNRRGGKAIAIDRIRDVHELAQNHGTKVHIDGARIFNAATALGVEASEIAQHADSIMFCLSKGLSAPVGSMLAGTRKFIEKAIQVRRRLGGGLRQSGVLAAAGIISLTEMVDRLAEDHENAQILVTTLAEIEELEIDPKNFDTNIIVISTEKIGITAPEFTKLAAERGIKMIYFDQFRVRMVTNHDASRNDVEYAADVLRDLIKIILKK